MWGHADIPTIHNRGAVADPANNHRYVRIEQNTNYLNLQPLRGCIFFGDCRYPHVADCASLIVNVGLLRLQPLRGCVCAVGRVVIIRVLCGRYFRGCIVSVGYAVAHPRLNPVGILPPGSRPSDVHSHDGIIAVMDAMTCEACEAEPKGEAYSPG